MHVFNITNKVFKIMDLIDLWQIFNGLIFLGEIMPLEDVLVFLEELFELY